MHAADHGQKRHQGRGGIGAPRASSLGNFARAKYPPILPSGDIACPFSVRLTTLRYAPLCIVKESLKCLIGEVKCRIPYISASLISSN